MSVESNQRRKYDKEFKVEAVRLLKRFLVVLLTTEGLICF